MNEIELARKLDQHRSALRAFVRAHAGALLRRESEDDLLQGIELHAVRVASRVEDRGNAEFFGWLCTLARQHFANRLRHHLAARRDAGALLRITRSGSGESSGVREPMSGSAGPATFAARRERLLLAEKALRLLSERDRALVRWMSEDVSLEEVATRLGLAYDAAKRARQRAIERFKATYELIADPKEREPPRP